MKLDITNSSDMMQENSSFVSRAYAEITNSPSHKLCEDVDLSRQNEVTFSELLIGFNLNRSLANKIYFS